MVLVILAHSYLSVNAELIHPVLQMFLWGVINLPAVAFVSISGAVFSYFLYLHPNRRAAYRRYATRATFLILLAHPAINLASYFFRTIGNGSPPGSLSFLEKVFLDFPITDTIAVCLLISPVVILCFGPVIRVAIIVILLVMAPLIAAFVNPVELSLLILKEALFGVMEKSAYFWFPLVPWFAIFLAGSFLGQPLADLKQGELSAASLVQRLKEAGIALAVCSLILTLGYKFLKTGFLGSWNSNLFRAIYPSQTTTLLPGYFAALAWLLAVLMYRIDISGRYDRFLWFLSILGRTSLFTFVIQFAVVESVPALLGLKGTLGLSGFLVLFVVGLTVVWILAYGYGRLRGWFTENDYDECAAAARASQGHSA